MKHKDLIHVLNALGRRINTWYPNVNSGGCCVYAAIIGEELTRRGIETRIIVAACGDAGKDIDKIKRKIANVGRKEEWNNNGIWFNHVGVEFKHKGRWYHYDSDGANHRKKDFSGYIVHPGRLTVEEAKAIADEARGWNTCFERNSIPRLRKHVKQYLATTLPQ